MKRIIIALESDFTNGVFKNNFLEEGFDVVATTTSGAEALQIINEMVPDVVLLDTNLPEVDGFDILNAIRNNDTTRRMPVVIYSKSGSEQHYEKALDYEANDFIVGISDSPKDIVTRVKAHLGEQKVYIFDVDSDINTASKMAADLGFTDNLNCSVCGAKLQLHLLRNLNLGKNIFNVSFACSSCAYRFTAK